MKKLIICLLAFVFITFCFTACQNKNSLDILPFLWENVVSEVPIRVVKEGAKASDVQGNGWELVSSD